ncbi:HGL247Cp [Eremothecium sinecaudum]|uniref:HGL247Cp n=1 Tax=Eremothecium sinecaudum TaxID=45286 RepID=A0A109UZW0_9SACH|nr:HGL247Cp [Eremothecium sinecaudum]AMD22093.1 HGL247Cp [Eremothecium sinecaudum]
MSLEDSLSKLSLYDAKKYFRKAQNVVFNFTEMEAKVREATNNEPWGASSSLMAMIAQGTYNAREREEILGMVFKRFVEKSASEWRQIYKSLQLLDYLIKNGSERFIDEVRSNLNLIRMLESFHYIDSQGRDQGINVRNRAQSLIKLLRDDSQIRAERKKARANSGKFRGVAGGIPSYIPGSSVNPAAGFTRSTSYGISISADYDSDDENQNNHSLHARDSSRWSDGHYEPNVPQEEEEEEEEDEFSEFQSAPPVTASYKNRTVESLTDSQRSSSQNTTDLLQDLNFQRYQPRPTPPKSTTSISIDKNDPFSVLLGTAKKGSSRSSMSPQKSTSNLSMPSKLDINEDTDDIFGELTSAPSAPIAQQANTNSKKANNSTNLNEVDLLSF